MFDIGFAEIIIIAVVGLLVIGPERLPGTIRTASVWLNRLRRSFNDIKREVQQELHNDAVMEELRKAGEQIKSGANGLEQDVQETTRPLSQAVTNDSSVPSGSRQSAEKKSQ